MSQRFPTTCRTVAIADGVPIYSWMRIGLCLALACAGCRGGGDASAAHPDGGGGRIVPVSAATVAVRDVPIYLDGLGNVIAFKTVTVRSQVDGRLERVFFKEGQAVKAGDLLAQIDPRPFAIQLQQAEGALARDKAQLHDNLLNLQRYTDLHDQKLVAQMQVDDQRAAAGQYQGAVQIDEAQIASAKLNLEYARIVSPIDGVTGVRLVDPGNLLHPTDTNGLVVVTQVDPIAVLFTLPQDDLQRVARELAKGSLTVEAWSRDGATRLGTGQLALIDNQINQATATLRLKAVFKNPDRLLWPNLFVKTRLLLTVLKGSRVMPSTALQHGPEGAFVYVIGADQTVAARAVEISTTEGDLAIVARGLEAGERVVTDGQNQLKPGARVQTKTP
jgi:multidrug efflux system membrane fusion protein